VAVVAIVVARHGSGVGRTQETSATPTSTVSTSPSASGSVEASPSQSASIRAASSTPDPQIAEVFSRIEEQVIRIRGLPRPDIGPADILTRAELEEELMADFEKDYTDAERRADNVTLRAMGLLEPDEDVADLQLALLQGAVLGFYDEDERRMAVVSDAGLTRDAQETYAHEYTHALQDGAVGLESMRLDVDGDDDGAMARLAVVEGDAMITMYAWSASYLGPDEPVPSAGSGASGDSDPDEAPPVEIPDFLIESLFFPYTYGTNFMSALHERGGYEAVNQALDDPPESTEQIVHPETYFDDEQPIEVAIPDLAAELGEGWEQVESTPIGEVTLRITIDQIGANRGSAEAAAAGWGGDHLVVAAGPDEAFALAWRLAWDSPADAAEFATIYRSAAEQLDFPARVVELGDGTVLVAHASTADLVDSVVAIAGG
ncbi:MAG: hypothetical protein ABR509_05960, partial [Candidatus Limnocylindria bacterium]